MATREEGIRRIGTVTGALVAVTATVVSGGGPGGSHASTGES
jgi:hypothetical protein